MFRRVAGFRLPFLATVFALFVGFAPNCFADLTLTEGQNYSYGDVPRGSSVPHVFTVTNTGNNTASRLSVARFYKPFTWTSGKSFPGGGTCGKSLAPGASCTFSIKFSPTAVGYFQQIFLLQYRDGSSRYVDMLISGRGI